MDVKFPLNYVHQLCNSNFVVFSDDADKSSGKWITYHSMAGREGG